MTTSSTKVYTEKEIDEIISDTEKGGTHWDKYFMLKVIKQLRSERDFWKDQWGKSVSASMEAVK